MLLFADVMFGPVFYILEYLPFILLALVLLAVALTGGLVGYLCYKKRKRR